MRETHPVSVGLDQTFQHGDWLWCHEVYDAGHQGSHHSYNYPCRLVCRNRASRGGRRRGSLDFVRYQPPTPGILTNHLHTKTLGRHHAGRRHPSLKCWAALQPRERTVKSVRTNRQHLVLHQWLAADVVLSLPKCGGSRIEFGSTGDAIKYQKETILSYKLCGYRPTETGQNPVSARCEDTLIAISRRNSHARETVPLPERILKSNCVGPSREIR